MSWRQRALRGAEGLNGAGYSRGGGGGGVGIGGEGSRDLTGQRGLVGHWTEQDMGKRGTWD